MNCGWEPIAAMLKAANDNGVLEQVLEEALRCPYCERIYEHAGMEYEGCLCDH